MNKKQTLAENYFDNLYSAKDDPWNLAESEYEAQKYEATINALPRHAYNNAFEIGCSVGVLTQKLAAKCANLLSVDVSEKALMLAQERCKGLPKARFKKMRVPQEFPDDTFDLILISEVGYFLTTDDWRSTMEKAFLRLSETGQIALVHWLPKVPEFPQTGDEVHDFFAQFMAGQMQNLHQSRTEHYRIDIWQKK